jgi:hypothetical protein
LFLGLFVPKPNVESKRTCFFEELLFLIVVSDYLCRTQTFKVKVPEKLLFLGLFVPKPNVSEVNVPEKLLIDLWRSHTFRVNVPEELLLDFVDRTELLLGSARRLK